MDYIITRVQDEFLEHHGIKGQKWGVRRYENADGTLTEEGKKRYGVSNGGTGNDRLAKKYSKSIKKLSKAYRNADLNQQIKDYSKYEKRAQTAKKIGDTSLGIALPTTGIFALTTPYNISAAKAALKYQIDKDVGAQLGLRAANDNSFRSLANFYDASHIDREQTERMFKEDARATVDAHRFLDKNQESISKVNSATQIIANVAAVSAGVSYGVAAYNKVRSSIAKRRLSEVGHEKAVARAKSLTEKLSKTFENTPYKAMLDTQIEMYKDQHPNTQMSDREILKSLMPLT